MIPAIIGLVTLVLVLSLLLLSLNLDTTWRWQVKAGAIVATMLTVVISYFALYELWGWPTGQDMPDNMRMLSADVVEPRKGGNEKGAIYVWVKPIGENNALPRAYELPYDPDFHEMIITALERSGQGVKQGVRRNPDYDKNTPGQGLGLPLNFFDIKPLRLPEKTEQRLGEQTR